MKWLLALSLMLCLCTPALAEDVTEQAPQTPWDSIMLILSETNKAYTEKKWPLWMGLDGANFAKDMFTLTAMQVAVPAFLEDYGQGSNKCHLLGGMIFAGVGRMSSCYEFAMKDYQRHGDPIGLHSTMPDYKWNATAEQMLRDAWSLWNEEQRVEGLEAMTREQRAYLLSITEPEQGDTH